MILENFKNGYEVTNGSNKALVFSSGNVEGGLSWTRSSTTLTVTHNSHGLSVGDYVVIRNMSEDYSYLEIQTVADVNTFTLTVANSGGTGGSDGAYIPAFDITALSDSALTFEAPSAGNVQLISVTGYINSSENAAITVTTPSNAIDNGAGKNNALNTKTIPTTVGYNIGGGTASKLVSFGLSYSTSADFNKYELSGGLGTFGAIHYVLQF